MCIIGHHGTHTFEVNVMHSISIAQKKNIFLFNVSKMDRAIICNWRMAMANPFFIFRVNKVGDGQPRDSANVYEMILQIRQNFTEKQMPHEMSAS